MKLAELYALWQRDLPAYCRSALRIMDKADTVRDLRLNPVQQALHDALEAQKRETGRVRALILKARQMGVSTYVAARFFHRAHVFPDGARAYVLSQDDKTAKKLLSMYKLLWEAHDPNLRRARVRSNDHEQHFAHGSAIEVNTASTPTGGRGGTITLFHGSEVAFWMHAEAHATGSMQQLSKQPGTEMILESTANGAVGAFYERWRSAELGRNEFMPLFFPWTTMPEYVAPPPPEFELTSDKPNDVILPEYEYAQKYGCTMAQMWWRRQKMAEFAADGSDGALRFAQEYPITADEAFLGGSGETFIAPATVEAARLRSTAVVGEAEAHPLILGLDPAPPQGSASSALVWRRGAICYRVLRLRGLGAEQLAMRVYREFTEGDAARICVDATEGTGIEVCTHLERFGGTAGRVVRVKFGDPAHDRSTYANVRAEIWTKMDRWLRKDAAIPDEVPMPGQATLASELLAPKPKIGQEKRVLLESKADMKRRGVASPDGADALACTFFYPDPAPGAHGFHVAPFGGELPDDPYRAPRGRVPATGPDDYHVAPFGGM